jgi:hypothetical protein
VRQSEQASKKPEVRHGVNAGDDTPLVLSHVNLNKRICGSPCGAGSTRHHRDADISIDGIRRLMQQDFLGQEHEARVLLQEVVVYKPRCN